MKKNLMIRAAWFFNLVGGVMIALLGFDLVWAAPLDDENRPRRILNDGAFYAWLKNGLLFYETTDHGKKGKYLYCGSDGYLVEISTPLAFSQMLQEQLKDAQGSRDFIQNRVPYAAASFLEPSGPTVLNEGYANYRKDLPAVVWINASKNDIKRSLVLLEKYGQIKTSIESGEWKSKFYLLLSDGSIEEWDLKGSVYPFTLDQLQRIVVEQKGSVSPVREYR